ncbi:MAG: saccharopine dehydrogenase family protein [Solirubrobacterales bacterium]
MTRKRGPIAVYGASGYTGKLVAAELARSDAEFVLSGRSRSKLEAVAEELGRSAPVHPASLDDAASLEALFADCSVVIDCAGPFTAYGEPVLRAAIKTGTHYLDTTGEQGYMDKVFRGYGADAERHGVAVIPAMGFDYVPGDMIATLAAEGMGKLEEISVNYAWVGFTPTRGTARSALEIAKGGDVEYRGGAWRPASSSLGRGTFDFGQPIGPQKMVRYPAGEQITVPRHIRTQNVRTAFTAESLAPSPRLAGLTPYVMRPFGLAMRTPLRRALSAAISRLPEGPSEADRKAVRFKVVCEARSREDTRRGWVSGRDVYGLTAASIVRGATIMAARGFNRRGALAPAQAFDPSDFLAALDRFEVRWGIEESPQRDPEPVESAA